jgi:hypothetical protein
VYRDIARSRRIRAANETIQQEMSQKASTNQVEKVQEKK